MFGYHPGFFGFDFFLLQRCPLCGHPFSFHLGKEWHCTECDCMGFPEKRTPVLSEICTCGHAKDAHYHGVSACGECSCFNFELEDV